MEHKALLAALFLCVALLLLPGASAEQREVTIGSVIKLRHERLKVNLHSHEVAYGSGSGQQSVTAFNGGDDANDYWIVKCVARVKPCKQGSTVPDGTSIRLQHMKTKKWLHSHMHGSPLSANFEVSGYGHDTQSDTGDNWRIEVEGTASVWKRDDKVRLVHEDLNAYLHSHNIQYGRPIAGQYEVCAIQKKAPENIWMATEGIYLPIRK